jgi:hypothetical protein
MDLDHFLTGGLPILIGLIFVAVFTAVTLLLTTKTDELTESPARRLKRASRGRREDPIPEPPMMITVRPSPAGALAKPDARGEAERTS